ncbi:MAG: T9SS type A sorting domain-containing protein [Bacteroidota bacterium]
MKKLAVFLSSILGSLSGLFAQDYWPSIAVPDSLNPFLLFPESNVEIADIDDDGIEDVLFYRRDSLGFRHMKGLGNGQFEEIPADQSILKDVINSALSYFPDSVDWADEVSDWKIRFADIDNLGDIDIMFSAGLKTWTGQNMCYDYFEDKYDQINWLVFTKYEAGEFNLETEELDALAPSCISHANVEFSDFDNDGDIDIIKGKVYASAKYLFDAEVSFYQFNETNLEFELINEIPANIDNSAVNWSAFSDRFKFHDFNNDGIEDIWEKWNLRLGNGGNSEIVLTNFHPPLDIGTPYPISNQVPSTNLGQPERSGLGDFENDGYTEWLVYDDALEKWRLLTQKCLDNPIGEACISFDFPDPETCGIEAFFNENCECELTQYLDSDADGICDNVDFTNGDCVLGGPCNDGDICTINESFDENCNCTGGTLLWDADDDGICNLFDQCPGENDLQDYNMNGIPDCLEIQSDADFQDDGIAPIDNADQKSLLEKQIKIYPNPSTGIFTLQAPFAIQQLRLLNAMGEEVHLFKSGQNQIDLSYLSKGLYFLEIKTKKHIFKKKVVLE